MPSRQVEQTFGLVIAFVFPGMIGLYALGFHAPLIQSWFNAPQATEFLLMIIAASGVGVFVSVVRWAIFEKALETWFPAPDDNARRKRHDDSMEQSLQGIIMQLYRYYQFCANTSVAVVGFYIAWLVSPAAAGAGGAIVGFVVLLALVAILGWSARDSWDRDQKARRELYLEGDGGV